jgi:lipopolysaccharide transport system ATP-binding protein
MSSDAVVKIQGLGKCYQIYDKPRDRLLQMLVRSRKRYYREFWALQDISLELKQGECLGIIGRNGAGKSTLLQLLCGTLTPTRGTIGVTGRIAALLELGAGFNHEFTGRENIMLSAAVMGLTQREIAAHLEEIIEFSGIRPFIDQPVKTYSSGMYVRLAFSVATSVNPDILVIDEALSVGDGEFSRKSFDRIMAMKDAGKTILFCSHALYQVEAICNRAIWLADGKEAMLGTPADVVMGYNDFLSSTASEDVQRAVSENAANVPSFAAAGAPAGTARITAVQVEVDGRSGRDLIAISGRNEIAVQVSFATDPTLPSPHVGICFVAQDGRVVASVGTHIDGHAYQRKADGGGDVRVVFPNFNLLRGEYRVDVYLLCERGVHVYDSASMAALIKVHQTSVELGIVTLPHKWSSETLSTFRDQQKP